MAGRRTGGAKERTAEDINNSNQESAELKSSLYLKFCPLSLPLPISQSAASEDEISWSLQSLAKVSRLLCVKHKVNEFAMRQKNGCKKQLKLALHHSKDWNTIWLH